MKRTILLLFVLTQATLSITQKSQPDKPRLLEGMQFAFKLSNGFNTTQSTHSAGNTRLTGGLVHQHAFNLELFRYLGKGGLFVGINAGIGINGFTFKTMSPELGYLNSEFFRYYDKLDAFEYYHADIGLGHAFVINSRWTLRNQFKAGVRANSSVRSGHGFSNGNVSLLKYEIETEGSAQQILRLESDLGLILKNKDILELGLFYTYTFSPAYTGEYTFFTDNSQGTFMNYGREIGLTLNYVFTGYSRREELFAARLSGAESRVDVRNAHRIHKPSSWLIGARTGLYFARFIVDKNSVLETSSAPRTSIGINFQKNSSSKAFWEGDLSMNTYQESTKTQYSTSSSYSDNNFILTLGAGRGYRLVAKNNYNWLNVSAGLDINFVGSEKGPNGSSTSRRSSGGIILLEVKSFTYTAHRFYPALYLNLSKEFRLGRNSFISLTYRRTEGFYSVIRNDIVTSGTDIPGGMESFESHFRGSTNGFGIGFWRRFGNQDKSGVMK